MILKEAYDQAPLFFGSKIVGKSPSRMWAQYVIIDSNASIVHAEVYCFNINKGKFILGLRSTILSYIISQHLNKRILFHFEDKVDCILLPKFIREVSIPVSLSSVAGALDQRFAGFSSRSLFKLIHGRSPTLTSALDDAICAQAFWVKILELQNLRDDKNCGSNNVVKFF